MRLGEQLLKDGLVTAAALEEALEAQVVHGGRLGTNLVELGLVSEADLARTLGTLLNCAFASGEMVPDAKALELVPTNQADDKELLPMRVDATRLSVAVVNPHDFTTLDAIAFKTGKRVVPVVIPEFRMNQLLRRYAKAFRPLRAIDMNAVRPRPKPGSQEEAELVKSREKAPDLMSEEEFQSLYAQALSGGADDEVELEEEIITGVEVSDAHPVVQGQFAPGRAQPTAGAGRAAPVPGHAGASVVSPPGAQARPLAPAVHMPPASSQPQAAHARGGQPPPVAHAPPPTAQAQQGAPAQRSAEQAAARAPQVHPGAQAAQVPSGAGPSAQGVPPGAQAARPPPGAGPMVPGAHAGAQPAAHVPPGAGPMAPGAHAGAHVPPGAGPMAPGAHAGAQPSHPAAQVPPPAGGARPLAGPSASGLGGRPSAPPPVPDVASPPPEAPLSPLSFAEAQAELARSLDREDVARTVLRFAAGKWRRNLLLSVQGSLVTGWHGMGSGVRESSVRRIGVALREQSTFRLVRDTRSHYIGPVRRDGAMAVFYKLLGGGFPTTAVILPLLVRGKVVHLLYVDNGADQLTPPDVGELLILSQSVGRSYEAMMKRRKGT
ncbi:general secretion pathway protein E [Myxococcus stipitatus DSM 14675]|uniref:General secretion pathway protein E n=1 Tax=Myxococcus stipitatus (strain DSM 14675 / JCM 12634 / Mx s8) TaxID=1278073 RepID=L7UEB2_MYXSD|nr:general secretion pathway protein GspE [Myxococcus stipitatus]AGC46210.1 general secretion pathway protein E [Myxococcus stipitatus DSM 14675]